MNRLILVLLLNIFLTLSMNAKPLITNDYQIEYNDNWKLSEKKSPPGWALTSEDSSFVVTLSSLTYPEGKDLIKLSKEWMGLRLKSEEELSKENKLKLNVDHQLGKIAAGIQMDYWGSNSNGRLFRYWGVVMKDRIINIYIETFTRNEEEIETELRTIVKTLKIR